MDNKIFFHKKTPFIAFATSLLFAGFYFYYSDLVRSPQVNRYENLNQYDRMLDEHEAKFGASDYDPLRESLKYEREKQERSDQTRRSLTSPTAIFAILFSMYIAVFIRTFKRYRLRGDLASDAFFNALVHVFRKKGNSDDSVNAQKVSSKGPGIVEEFNDESHKHGILIKALIVIIVTTFLFMAYVFISNM